MEIFGAPLEFNIQIIALYAQLWQSTLYSFEGPYLLMPSSLLTISIYLVSEFHQHVHHKHTDVNIQAGNCAVGDQTTFSIQTPPTSPRFVLSITCTIVNVRNI